MPTVAECRTCLPLDLVTKGPYEYYSLDGEIFYPPPKCPTNVDCSNADSLNMVCCGNKLSVSLVGTTGAQRDNLINDLIAQCQQLLFFCNQQGNKQLDHNHPCKAAVKCPDGSIFEWSVPGGYIAAATQQLADSTACADAQSLAAQHKLCLSCKPPKVWCANSPLKITITATGAYVDASANKWSIASGQLPNGMSMPAIGGPVIDITGTPTDIATNTFIVSIQTPSKDVQYKQISVCIVGIYPASATLPGGTVGTPYSVTFTEPLGCSTAPLTWQVSSGSLPPGLVLNSSTGVLSGTPILAGVYPFTIELKDSA